MTSLDTVVKMALELPEEERATLAAHMLSSLSSPPHDGRVKEAERRLEEIEKTPSIAIDLETLDQKISSRETR